MSSEDFGLSTRSVAELALVISRAAGRLLNDAFIPTTASLRSFWQSTRSLQKRWMDGLDSADISGSLDMDYLERLAPRVFACEMLVRTWSTILASLDRSRGTEDLTAVSRNVVNGLLQTRHRVLSNLLNIPEADHERVMTIDRLRRRCDRWTDLLVGRLAAEHDCFEFAFDPERARDFSEEGLIPDPATGPLPIDHLISAGLRLTFLQHLPAGPVDEPEFSGLMRAILSCFSPQSFEHDASQHLLLKLRIAAAEHRTGQPAAFEWVAFKRDVAAAAARNSNARANRRNHFDE